MTGLNVNLIDVLVILLLPIVIGNVQSSCPTNCLCYLERQPRKVLCSNQGIVDFPEKINDTVEHLDLSNNNIHIIPADISRLVELKYINLSNNQLTGLPDTFGNLWKLEKLDLSNNLISNSAEKLAAIEKLPNLRLLYLGKNPINNLDNLVNHALRALDVNSCIITQLKNDSLNGLPELISLNLNGNPLTSIQYIRNEKLKWLDISNCMLNLIRPNTFDNVPELEQLLMANNQMLVFSTRKETLRHDKLKRLDVSGCNLDRPGLHGFPSLTHAKLSRNSIRFLPDRIFSKNKMLTYLYLNDNGLNQLNSSSFFGLSKLEILDLSTNVIENFHQLLFRDNIHLRLLNLSFNNIRYIPKNFSNSAIILDLSSNLIESIPNNILINMPRIKTLNLSKNRLELLNVNMNSDTLTTLLLEGNRLVKLTNESFQNLPALTNLDLSGNRLTEGINYDVFQNNLDLQKILLHDNPWRCDCEQLYPTFVYLMQGSKTKSSTLICQSPNNVSGYSWTTACYKLWNKNNHRTQSNNQTHGFILVGLIIAILIFGSCVSIGHTIKTKKRQAILRLQEAERAEARERLIQHRRRRQIEDMRAQENNILRVHPAELIGPPTYEEAVDMPRFVRSLENFDSITSIDGVGQSGQSFDHDAWTRKRRMQTRKRMVGKRAKSVDNLDSRREENIDNNPMRNNKNIECKTSRSNRASSSERHRRNVIEFEESICSAEDGSKRYVKPRTPNNNKRKRRVSTKYNGHSSDDEDSDELRNSTVGVRNCGSVNNEICVINLPREPRSGTYRPPVTMSLPSTSLSPDLVSSTELCDTSVEQQHILRSKIV